MAAKKYGPNEYGVLINEEPFRVRLLANGQVDYSWLAFRGSMVTSQVLRDVFWNRYLGRVYSEIREYEKKGS